MSCPPEFAAQVDAATECPFTSRNAPVGNWGINGKGNVFLTEPNFSFHYFNVDRGYYFQQADGADQQGYSVYYTPPGDRYYNPSLTERQEGAYFIGIYWQTAKEKMCFRNNEGELSLTLRKHVKHEVLPRHRVAIYINSLGMQRLVRVNERGIYSGQDQKLLAEIRFWLANNVPVGYIDGPRLFDDLPPRARLISPPPDEADDASQHFGKHESIEDGSKISRHSTPDVKEEDSEFPEALDGVNPRQSSPEIKKEMDDEQQDDMDDIQTSFTSARVVSARLFAARKAPEVQGARISKRATPQESPTKRAIHLRPDEAIEACQQAFKGF